MSDSKTATSIIDRRFDREASLRRSTDTIMGTLRDFIPHACHRDAYEMLFKAFDEHNLELTTQDMRERYRAWEKLQIQGLSSQAVPPVVVPT